MQSKSSFCHNCWFLSLQKKRSTVAGPAQRYTINPALEPVNDQTESGSPAARFLTRLFEQFAPWTNSDFSAML